MDEIELKYQIQIRDQLIYFAANDHEKEYWEMEKKRLKEKLKEVKSCNN